MSSRLRTAAVRYVKPRVGPAVWSRLRAAGGRPPAARPSLTDLAIRFDTDKAGRHSYTPHYERHLGHLRDQAFTLLEIGIGGNERSGRRGGESLRMWKAYFPHARIVGLDIEDRRHVAEDRITPYVGSQVDEALLRRIVAENGPIQVVVDDGSHRSDHVRETFRILFPLLADHGIYAIEDTHTSYWPRLGGSLDRKDPTTTMGLVKDLVDGIQHEEYGDPSYEPTYTDTHVTSVAVYHNLVFVQKGDNRENHHYQQLKRKYGLRAGRPAPGR